MINPEDHCQSSQPETPGQNLSFRFGPEQCLLLVKKRIQLDHIFVSKKEHKNQCWQIVVDQLGWKGMLTWAQAKKKWENSLQVYRHWKKGTKGADNQDRRLKNLEYLKELDKFLTNRPNDDSPVEHFETPNIETESRRSLPQETITFNYQDDEGSEPVQIEIRCENNPSKASQIAEELERMLNQTGRWKRKRPDFELDKEFKQYLSKSLGFQKRIESRLEKMADSFERYTQFMMNSRSSQDFNAPHFAVTSHPIEISDDITIIQTTPASLE